LTWRSKFDSREHELIARRWARATQHQIFTYGVMFRASDCATCRKSIMMRLMAPLLPPIELTAPDKLDILQRLDRYRKWRSLEDKRYCLACGQLIKGRDIVVVGGTRGTGPLRLVCPTQQCHSIPMDWVIPTDEVFKRMAMLEAAKYSPRKSNARSREKFSERLRRFALHFRPAA